MNSIAKCVADLNLPKEHDHSAHRFHSDLFLSGFERIILVSLLTSLSYQRHPLSLTDLTKSFDDVLPNSAPRTSEIYLIRLPCGIRASVYCLAAYRHAAVGTFENPRDKIGSKHPRTPIWYTNETTLRRASVAFANES